MKLVGTGSSQAYGHGSGGHNRAAVQKRDISVKSGDIKNIGLGQGLTHPHTNRDDLIKHAHDRPKNSSIQLCVLPLTYLPKE